MFHRQRKTDRQERDRKRERENRKEKIIKLVSGIIDEMSSSIARYKHKDHLPWFLPAVATEIMLLIQIRKLNFTEITCLKPSSGKRQS